jgi:hypothetical protein
VNLLPRHLDLFLQIENRGKISRLISCWDWLMTCPFFSLSGRRAGGSKKETSLEIILQ